MESHTIFPVKLEINLNNIEDCEKVLAKVQEIKEKHSNIIVTIRVQ